MKQSRDGYGVQTFIEGAEGILAQGDCIECRSADEARLLAEQTVDRKLSVGAAAFLRPSYSQEFNDASEPITLAVFGTVPAGVEETIPF